MADISDGSPSRLRLTDCTGRPVVLVRAAPDGRVAAGLGVVPGRLSRDRYGRLATRPGPGEWLLIGGDREASATVSDVEALADGEFATAVDLTHAFTLVRLTGRSAAAVLSTLCALDLGERAAPDGSAFRTLVAGVTTTVLRDDADGVRSYLLVCDRSYARYIADTLHDAIRT